MWQVILTKVNSQTSPDSPYWREEIQMRLWERVCESGQPHRSYKNTRLASFRMNKQQPYEMRACNTEIVDWFEIPNFGNLLAGGIVTIRIDK